MLDGMDLRLGYDVFDTVVADVCDAVDTLDGSRRRAAHEVDRLLDGGWNGAAAESFAGAWQEWCAGADQVRTALTSIVVSLEATRRELAATDGATAAASLRLLGRLD